MATVGATSPPQSGRGGRRVSLPMRIAEFVHDLRHADLPDGVTGIVTDAVTDGVGVGLAGTREDVAGHVRNVIGSADPGAPLLGSAVRASAMDAAMYNGTVVHALDYDDFTQPAYSHPTAHLLPVLISLGARREVSGAELVAAYVAGLEIEGKLGRTLNMGHYLRGWHTTSTFGTLAAAAAAARLLRLAPQEIATALSVAASMACGLRVNFGSMTKPVHAGIAARNGILAAQLARSGCTASPDALTGRFGFFDVFADGECDLSAWAGLGSAWEVVDPRGLALKPYPSCGATQPVIEAALLARRDLASGSIRSVDVGTSRYSADVLVYDRPRDGLEAKFSMQYCVARALVSGSVGLAHFLPGAVADSEVRDLMARIAVRVSTELRENREFGASVTVTTGDGRQIQHLVATPRGKPERPLSTDELYRKFADVTSQVIDEPAARRRFAALQSLASGTGADLAEAVRIDAPGSPR